ncbi:cornifelin homolog B-like [Echeneis naucrates]|uniref:Cornifelin homolog B-like n=1 Tax=Echeneis naucrates TaxID=173247 RepID=A0A665TUH6_ECHNA|nr:cornifelin homolog B-like [Echeneis naucrates]XP_029375564.1 cornifelin homolog B-like [Echeneis naucrates]
MTSTVVIQQPVVVMNRQDSDQWGSGICDCFQNMPECCFAFWCFPCFTCKTARDYGECLCLPLLDGYLCSPPITMSMRASMRERYGIRGSICNDCVYATFCNACTWCQMSREMKKRKHQIVLVSAKHT